MTVLGADKLIQTLGDLPKALQRPITAALLQSAAEMQAYAVPKIQKNSGTGRTYKRGRRTHIASSSGEFPNTDTGALVAAMRFEEQGPFSVIWGAFIRYAKYLEFGTSRMAARPFIRPTFKMFQAKATKRVGDAVTAALRSYGR
ncbi:hypothetical protein QWJ07_03980 [Frankia sp. RB7]|nr:hypothetical protein [Frankia sp. RB7]